jgi:hypothetical protein
MKQELILLPQQEQKPKISEIFRQAVREKIPQCRGNLSDHKGAYCAQGLLCHKILGWNGQGSIDVKAFNSAVLNAEIKFRENSDYRGITELNDVEGWTWEDFANAFERIESQQ